MDKPHSGINWLLDRGGAVGRANLGHEVRIWGNVEEGTSGEVKVHQDLPEGGTVLGLGLPGDSGGVLMRCLSKVFIRAELEYSSAS